MKSDFEKEWASLDEEGRRVEAGRIRLEAERERFEAELEEILSGFEKTYKTRNLDEIESKLNQRSERAKEVIKAWKEKIEAAKAIGRETQAKLAELKG